MRTLKVGFIGVGGIARVHLTKLEKMPEVTVTALCDINLAKVVELARKYKAKTYTDYHEMLEEEELDAVWVCIPPYAHKDEVIMAAEQGINVFVEKPIALDLRLAKEMERAVERAGVKSWVGYHFRQYSSVRRVAKMLVEEGGPIGLLTGYWWGSVPRAPWWTKRELSGGQVVEQTTHIFDLARFLVGEVERVYAEFNTLIHKDVPDFTIEDVSIVTLRFKSGCVGVITSTSGAKPDGYHVGVELISKNLQAEIKGAYAKVLKGEEVIEIKSKEDPYFVEDLKFVHCILEDLEPEVPISEGVKTLEVTLAAVKSAESGEVVRLPLSTA